MAVTVASSNHSPGVAPQIGLSTDAQNKSMTQGPGAGPKHELRPECLPLWEKLPHGMIGCSLHGDASPQLSLARCQPS